MRIRGENGRFKSVTVDRGSNRKWLARDSRGKFLGGVERKRALSAKFGPKKPPQPRDDKGRFKKKPPGVELLKPWRLTLGLNYVWAHDYRSYTYTEFYDKKPTDQQVEDAKRKAYQDLKTNTKFGKYSRAEWWFDDEFNVELTQVDAKGSGGFEDWSTSKPEKWTPSGKQRERFARRMIETGKWRKPETLDKWMWVMKK